MQNASDSEDYILAVRERRKRRIKKHDDSSIIAGHFQKLITAVDEINSILYRDEGLPGRLLLFNDTDMKTILKLVSKIRVDILTLSGFVGSFSIKKMGKHLDAIPEHIRSDIQAYRERKKGKVVYFHDVNGDIITYRLTEPHFEWEDDYSAFLITFNVARNRLSRNYPNISNLIGGKRIMWHGTRRDLADLLNLLWTKRFLFPNEISVRNVFSEFDKYFVDQDNKAITGLRDNYNDVKKYGVEKFQVKIT